MAEGGTTPHSHRFDRLAYRDPRPSPALIRALGPINRHVILPHLVGLREIDFPREDLERLRGAVRPGTAAFIGPCHPEFFTDWMLDKELSRRISPLMAHWASYEIVNLNRWVQAFWLCNNLVANAPGGGGVRFSVDWALKGHGVLLHPEGTATWRADRVGPLVPGIVEMAWQACRRARERGREIPVLIVPVVWKLHFVHDVSKALAGEMAYIERRLELPSGVREPVEERFATLMTNVLERQCGQFGFRAPSLDPRRPGPAFFDAQQEFADFLRRSLEQRYGEVEGDIARVIHTLRRAARRHAATDPGRSRADRRIVDEIERLHTFTRDLYGGAWLLQEHIAENLKRLRTSLLTGTTRDQLHALAPVAVARRAAHIRAPEPIAVSAAYMDDDGVAAEVKAQLLDLLRERLQAGLDGLNAEVAPTVTRFRRPNPMRE